MVSVLVSHPLHDQEEEEAGAFERTSDDGLVVRHVEVSVAAFDIVALVLNPVFVVCLIDAFELAPARLFELSDQDVDEDENVL